MLSYPLEVDDEPRLSVTGVYLSDKFLSSTCSGYFVKQLKHGNFLCALNLKHKASVEIIITNKIAKITAEMLATVLRGNAELDPGVFVGVSEGVALGVIVMPVAMLGEVRVTVSEGRGLLVPGGSGSKLGVGVGTGGSSISK